MIMGGEGTTDCFILDTETNEIDKIDSHPGEWKYFFSPSEFKIRDRIYAFGNRFSSGEFSIFCFNTTTEQCAEIFQFDSHKIRRTKVEMPLL